MAEAKYRNTLFIVRYGCVGFFYGMQVAAGYDWRVLSLQITKQMLKARPLHGGTTLEWAQFISEVDAMQQQIRQHILDEIETRRRLCLITCTINLLSQFSSLSHVPEGLELVG